MGFSTIRRHTRRPKSCYTLGAPERVADHETAHHRRDVCCDGIRGAPTGAGTIRRASQRRRHPRRRPGVRRARIVRAAPHPHAAARSDGGGGNALHPVLRGEHRLRRNEERFPLRNPYFSPHQRLEEKPDDPKSYEKYSGPDDGISILPTLLGRGGQRTHDALYWEGDFRRRRSEPGRQWRPCPLRRDSSEVWG